MTPQPTRLKTYPFPRDHVAHGIRDHLHLAIQILPSDSEQLSYRHIAIRKIRTRFLSPQLIIVRPYYVRKWSNESNTCPPSKKSLNFCTHIDKIVRVSIWKIEWRVFLLKQKPASSCFTACSSARSFRSPAPKPCPYKGRNLLSVTQGRFWQSNFFYFF